MRILVTGADGFIGKNLVSSLRSKSEHELLLVSRRTELTVLKSYCERAEFIFHLAGVNRPKTESEFTTCNVGFTETLIDLLAASDNRAPIVFASSKKATEQSGYGKSKMLAEQVINCHAEKYGCVASIFRLPNVFGKWCRPNYNSVVATFCHNVLRNQRIRVDDPDTLMELVYIDDVIEGFVGCLSGSSDQLVSYPTISPQYSKRVGELADLLTSFQRYRKTLGVPDLADQFNKKMYSAFLSYLPKSQFSSELVTQRDDRGSFTEILRSDHFGQLSVNISNTNVVKGQHWHHTKVEKFLVVSGQAIIRFRKIGSNEILKYAVDGNKLQMVDIPPGYTHHIENVGDSDLITLIWANESFDSKNPDTFAEVV